MKILCATPWYRGVVMALGLCCGLLAASAGCGGKASVSVGGACTIHQSCVTGVCLKESETSNGRAWLGGYCSGNCSVNQCPQGSCVELADGISYCVSECESGDDCRKGYVCSPDAKACLPDCRLGWSCGDTLTCDSSSGACSAPKVTPLPVGSACTLNAGCQGGLCIPQTSTNGGTAWREGTCTQDCSSATCPNGSTCFTFVDGNARCLAACSPWKGCRQGYVCSSDVRVCLPDCRLGWSCGSALVCDSSTGECEAMLIPDAGARTDTHPASPDAGRDTVPARSPDAFTPGFGGFGGAGGAGTGGPGPGGRT